MTGEETGTGEISIHVPTRGTTGLAFGTYAFIRFQSTFPQGERLPLPCRSLLHGNFNPRSHKGNDVEEFVKIRIDEIISIHVPTKGTTLEEQKNKCGYKISIHVPTRGTTGILVEVED